MKINNDEIMVSFIIYGLLIYDILYLPYDLYYRYIKMDIINIVLDMILINIYCICFSFDIF